MEGYNPEDEESSYGMLIESYNKNEEQKKSFQMQSTGTLDLLLSFPTL